MRKALWCGVALVSLSVVTPTQAAGIPVIDVANLAQAVKEVAQMGQMVTQAIAQVHALTNIPQNITGQVAGLLEGGIQNPLGAISGNLQTLLTGSGTGTCTGAGGMLEQTQYAPAVGGDFTGASMNGSAYRLAGLQACTQQMLSAQQERIQQLPQMLDTLQGCGDVTCAQTVSARLQYEMATETAQGNEATLMGWNAQFQRWTSEDQIMQKQRSDFDQLQTMSGGNQVGLPATITPSQTPGTPPTDAPLFGA